MKKALFYLIFVPISLDAAFYSSLISFDKDKVVSNFWGFEMPLNGYKKSKPLETGSAKQLLALEKQMQGNPSPTKQVRLTLVIEEYNDKVTAKQCYQRMGSGRLRQAGVKNVASGEKPLVYRLYDFSVPDEFTKHAGHLTNRHGYGYWSRNYQCFEMHLSNLYDPSETSQKEIDEEMMLAMHSFRLESSAPGMIRAVVLNLSSKPPKTADDPMGFTTLAGIYLHDEKASNPNKALLLYRSALKLGIKDDLNLWVTYEGIAYVYRKLNRPKEALGYFQKSAAVAEKNIGTGYVLASQGSEEAAGIDQDQLRQMPKKNAVSSYFNLACTHSVLGNVDEGKKALKKVFELIGSSNREIQKYHESTLSDQDLENLRKSPGFNGWLSQIVVGG